MSGGMNRFGFVFMLTVAVAASGAVREAGSWQANFLQGVAAISAGDYDRAQTLIERARQHVEQGEVGGMVRARVAYALGYLYRLKGEFDRAEPLLTEAVSLLEPEGEKAYPDLSLCIDGLGELRVDQARHFEAERLFLRAVELNTRVRGAKDPRTLASLQHLGEAYRREGRFGDAEKTLLEAVDGLRATGTQPKATAAALSALGTLYCDQGRLDEAEATLSKALSMNLPEGDEPVVADSMLVLATAFRESGKIDRAMPLLKKAEAIYVAHNDPRAGLALHGIGLIHLLEGRRSMAEEALVEAHRVVTSSSGTDSPIAALINIDLAIVYNAAKRRKEACSLIDTALPCIREHYGTSRPGARALITCALIHAEDRQMARADAEFREALDILERVLPPDNPTLIDTRQQYSVFCKRLRK
jgi:tetratricopeptide (TPR) repeat protein